MFRRSALGNPIVAAIAVYENSIQVLNGKDPKSTAQPLLVRIYPTDVAYAGSSSPKLEGPKRTMKQKNHWNNVGYKSPTSYSVFVGIGVFFILITWALPFVLSASDTFKWMIHEDSVGQYWGAISLFIAAIVFFVVFRRSKTSNSFWRWHTRHNYFYLLLALLFLFGAGEEISWGQRIFHFSEVDRSINVQGETTIHNLQIFDRNVPGHVLNFNRLFVLFWLTFCVVTPLGYRLSPKLRAWLNRVGIPIVPLEFGFMLVLSYLLSRSYDLLIPKNAIWYDYSAEIYESQAEFIFALLGIAFLWAIQASSKNTSDVTEAPALDSPIEHLSASYESGNAEQE